MSKRTFAASKKKGGVTEELFELAANYYRNDGRLNWHKTYPEFVVLEQTDEGHTVGFFRDVAAADYVLSLPQMNGRTVWVEVKGFITAAHTRKHTQGLHQYDQMALSERDGDAAGFYLVCWTDKKNWRDPLWRLYPVASLEKLPKSLFQSRPISLQSLPILH